MRGQTLILLVVYLKRGDTLEVELLHYAPPFPDKYIATAMRRTRDTKSIQRIQESLDAKKGWVKKLVRLAKRSKHYGVFEHIMYWFNVEQVSRVLTHELIRHRLVSYAQLSGRTTNIENGYVVPTLDYVADPKKRADLQQFFESKFRGQFADYKWLVKNRVRVEDARYLLPNGQWTCIMITINARSLMHVIRMRVAPEAHWEIRELASRMWNLAKPTAPVLFESIPDDI